MGLPVLCLLSLSLLRGSCFFGSQAWEGHSHTGRAPAPKGAASKGKEPQVSLHQSRVPPFAHVATSGFSGPGEIPPPSGSIFLLIREVGLRILDFIA